MITTKTPKHTTRFECQTCAFITSNKKDYSKHLNTAKHKKTTNGNYFSPKKPLTYICYHCHKQFKYPSGLSRHNKQCKQTIHDSVSDTNSTLGEITKNHILELLKQNQEFKQLLTSQQQEIQHLHKQIIDSVKHAGDNIQNQTNINNNHQKFNLNFFLNEQCKDAINMSDFLENITLDIQDLTETGRLGYVGGISRILVNKLQELDVYKRPLHCTDMKRETLYIKENDEWAKEDNSKDKLKEIVDKVSNKNCRNIKQWTDQHPEYQLFDSSENMEYIKLCGAVLGGLGEEETRQFREKIVKNIFKEIMVNK